VFARYGHYQFPAIQSLDNFYCRQRPSGFICREYREADGAAVHYDSDGGLFSPKGWKNAINPPIFSWAECESYKVTGDKSRFAEILPVLEKYVEWLNRDGDPEAPDWETNGRRSKGTPHGLYWNTSLGSGLDNTPKPTDPGCGWVDMSCQMVKPPAPRRARSAKGSTAGAGTRPTGFIMMSAPTARSSARRHPAGSGR
jgi:hypothetical protein